MPSADPTPFHCMLSIHSVLPRSMEMLTVEDPDEAPFSHRRRSEFLSLCPRAIKYSLFRLYVYRLKHNPARHPTMSHYDSLESFNRFTHMLFSKRTRLHNEPKTSEDPRLVLDHFIRWTGCYTEACSRGQTRGRPMASRGEVNGRGSSRRWVDCLQIIRTYEDRRQK